MEAICNERIYESRKDFLKSMFERARSILIRENVFATEKRNPTIEIELTYNELEMLIELLTEKSEPTKNKVEILPIVMFLQYADKVKQIVDNNDTTWEEKFDLIFSHAIQKGIRDSGVDLNWTDPNFSDKEDVLSFAHAVELKAKELR